MGLSATPRPLLGIRLCLGPEGVRGGAEAGAERGLRVGARRGLTLTPPLRADITGRAAERLELGE